MQNFNFDVFDIKSVNAERKRLGLVKMTKREYLAWVERHCDYAGIEGKVEIVQEPREIVSTLRAVVIFNSAYQVFTYVIDGCKHQATAKVRAENYDLVEIERPLLSQQPEAPVRLCA